MLRALLVGGLLGLLAATSVAQTRQGAANPVGGPAAADPFGGGRALGNGEARPERGMQSVKVAAAPVAVESAGSLGSEQRIRNALNEKTDLEFVETPLKEALTFISDKHHIDIQYDTVALRDAKIDPTAIPVSLNAHGIRLKSALNLILVQQNMAYAIENEVLQITTKAKNDAKLTMRVYDVRDLADAENIDQLVEILSLTPSGNLEVGALKAMKSDGAYLVYASKPVTVHEEIEQLLADFRRVKLQR